MPAKKDFYTTTREEAAELLGVSTRTLDRYAKGGKLRTKLSASRNILIHEKDLVNLRKNLGPKKTTSSRPRPIPTREVEAMEAIEVATENVEEKVFRELYEETNKELRAKQEKLEAASFRVGQLEAQLKNSVPLLEHKQKEQELDAEKSRLKEKLVGSILKSWVFLGVAILATAVAATLGFLLYL
ncbi:hypothetical protein K9N08_01645 [Candidatus Gracilibacteria bacterium]|nr:hypothetical protein [Candidatus Gracilibacteria bacterium]MCF7856243.1 hypothetical protein [Candidatus Gracilibacteria bacterium]MCF7896692.1 hypothetical protein [Candidatus Gracilibacteria bacterium]